jgi:hypothetical protein
MKKLMHQNQTQAQRRQSYRQILGSATKNLYGRKIAKACSDFKLALRRLDKNGKILSYEWVTGKAAKSFAKRIRIARSKNRCK